MRLGFAISDLTRPLAWCALAIAAPIGLLLLALGTTVNLDAPGQAIVAGLTITVFAVGIWLPGHRVTALLIVMSSIVSLRYLVWRLTETLDFDTVLQSLLGTLLILAEGWAIILLALRYIRSIWPLPRQPIALPLDTGLWPTVDVFIACDDATPAAVRVSVLAAQGMDWPRDKLRVFLLTQENRSDLHEFAATCGAFCFDSTDDSNELNQALRRTRGEFVALFRCGHVPTRAWLQLTMGWLVSEARLAFIQTPCGEPTAELGARAQQANDFWNAVLLCNSGCVIRRSALHAIDGFVVDAEGGSLQTGRRLHRNGWQSAYLDLAVAGAPIPRRWSSSRPRRLLSHHLPALPRAVLLAGPLAYLLLGQTVITAPPALIAVYALPHLIHAFGTTARIRGWSTAAALRPRPADGKLASRIGWPERGSLLLALLLLLGLGQGLIEPTDVGTRLLYAAWAAGSLLIVMGGLVASLKRAAPPAQSGFATRLQVVVWLQDGRALQGASQNLSVRGGSVLLARPDWLQQDDAVECEFSIGGHRLFLPARVERWSHGVLQVGWTAEDIEQERDIVRLVFGRADTWLDEDAIKPRPVPARRAAPRQSLPRPRRLRALLGALLTVLLIGAAPIAAAQAPASPVPTETRNVAYTLRAIGAPGPITLRGGNPQQTLVFGIRADEVVTDAYLTLSGAFSPSLLPDNSAITVTVNDQYVGTIPVTPNRPLFGPLQFPLDAKILQDRNRLTFHLAGRDTRDCDDPLSGLQWATISDASALTMTLTSLPLQRNLARLPRPFFDPNASGKLMLPFVLGAGAAPETLQAAAIVASWFGGLAANQGVSFPVLAELPATSNGIVVINAADSPPGPGMPSIDGPTIAELANPNDSHATLLLIAGRNGTEVLAAANALALGSRMLDGEQQVVQPPILPVHLPYDASAWISTQHPVRFAELVNAAALQGVGYKPPAFQVPFRTAGDLYTWRRRPFTTAIYVRGPPGPLIDAAASRLDVSLNGTYLHSYPLAPTDSTANWIMRQFGLAQPMREATTALPLSAVRGQNDLRLQFDARPSQRSDCAVAPGDIPMAVDPDSTLDLTGAYHIASLPDLSLFAGSGFPFSRLADLADTAVVLPEQPSAMEISAFLELMGFIGSRTGTPVSRVSVIASTSLARVPDKDLLVIGTLGDLGAAASLLERGPYRATNGTLRVTLPNALPAIWPLTDTAQTEERRRLTTLLAMPLADGSAALVGVAGPRPGRSVVALLSGTPDGLGAMIAAMQNGSLAADIRGDLALLNGGWLTSYRAGSTYIVGDLPYWLWVDWLLQDRPILVGAILLLAAVMLGICVLRLVRWRAARRLGQRAVTQE